MSMVGNLANLHDFQAMTWVYIDAVMQQYAVLRSGGDSSSTYVIHVGHVNNNKWMGCQYRGVFAKVKIFYFREVS
jgi:hypothetical protein